MSARLLVAVLLAALLVGPTAQHQARASAPQPTERQPTERQPTERQWRADVRQAMRPAPAYLRRRVERATPDERLALNLDVDNTMLATEYAVGRPVRPVLELTRLAHRLGVAVFVNTARDSTQRSRTRRALTGAGFGIDALCLRRPGTSSTYSKPHCRERFRSRGYVLVANVGNNPHDFTGGGYERAFRLPNYGGRLS